jgi:hypothetical protein
MLSKWWESSFNSSLFLSKKRKRFSRAKQNEPAVEFDPFCHNFGPGSWSLHPCTVSSDFTQCIEKAKVGFFLHERLRAEFLVSLVPFYQPEKVDCNFSCVILREIRWSWARTRALIDPWEVNARLLQNINRYHSVLRFIRLRIHVALFFLRCCICLLFLAFAPRTVEPLQRSMSQAIEDDSEGPFQPD